VLYNVCKDQNPNTYFISSREGVQPEWFNNNEKVGICGATSTPMWLMEQVKAHIEQF
jgi:4-hydroxy-3-methylbut-2-enyl diphosphate reductase